MIILSNKDLEAYEVSQSISALTFMGRVFVRGESFAQHFRRMAIAVAKEILQSGSPCLLFLVSLSALAQHNVNRELAQEIYRLRQQVDRS